MIVHLSFFWGTIGFRTFRKCQWISETLRVSGIFRVVNESKVADWICHFGHDPNLYPFSTDCKRYQMLRVHFLCFFCSESDLVSLVDIVHASGDGIAKRDLHNKTLVGSIWQHSTSSIKNITSYNIIRYPKTIPSKRCVEAFGNYTFGIELLVLLLAPVLQEHWCQTWFWDAFEVLEDSKQ